jgi:hypothetical protein
MTRTAATKIREYFIRTRDAERVIVKQNGEVRVYGPTISGNRSEWYYGGHAENVLDMIEEREFDAKITREMVAQRGWW